MCGLYVAPEVAAIEREWEPTRIRDRIKNLQLDRLSHATQVRAIRRIEAGAAEGQHGAELVTLHRGGLIPFWAKGVAPRFGTIMAICEPFANTTGQSK